MANNMKVILFLAISSLFLSQPNTKTDSVSEIKIEIPEAVKPTVEKIEEEVKETKKLEEATTKEMLKQLELIREIKMKVLELKKEVKFKQKASKTQINTTIDNKATKEEEVLIEVEGQIVHWETRKKSWLGRMFSGEDILHYKYIIDKEGNKVYLK